MNNLRRKELEHFCRQFGEYEENIRDINLVKSSISDGLWKSKTDPSEVTSKAAIKLAQNEHKLEIIKKAIVDTLSVKGYSMYYEILDAVTNGTSYDTLVAQNRVFVCKDTWYSLLTNFYENLDKLRC